MDDIRGPPEREMITSMYTPHNAELLLGHQENKDYKNITAAVICQRGGQVLYDADCC